MKKVRLLIILSLIACCLLVMCACDDLTALSSPTDVEVEMTTLTLKWNGVKDARMYTVSVTPVGGETKEYVSGRNSYSLSQLKVGEYTIKVKANGKDEVNADSEWSEAITFVKEREPGMAFTLINGGTEYEVTDKGIATGDIVIPDTYRGKPVTSIGKKAFFNKSDVTSVKIGKNVRSIGSYAFANCSYVTSVTLPEGLTSIGESAFASCRLLSEQIVIPNGVKEISDNAFAYCSSLTGVTLGTGLESIGANAFTDCRALERLVIPDNVVSVGEYAFSVCESLLELTLGDGLEVIGNYAFSGLSSLESVVVPNGVKTIGEGAFFNCTALDDVTLGDGVTSVGLGAFNGTALWEGSSTNEVYVGGWLLGLKDTTAASVTFRENTIGIANKAFYKNSALTDVILPDSVKIIDKAAFAISKISSIVIGSGVHTVGAQAFEGCQNLSTVILGSYDFSAGKLKSSSLKTIDSYAFRDCVSLYEIEIPEGVTTIGSHAFRSSGIYEASSTGVVYAGNWIVDYTDALSGDIQVLDGTVGISNYAFYKCTGITSVSLPSSVKLIGRAAFYECTELVSVFLPETLEVIEDYTFYHCDNLRQFILPPMLKSIGRSAFYKCGTATYGWETDTDSDVLFIPDRVEYIGDYAFYGCGIEIPANQQMGDEDSLYGIDILIIGSSVKSIGSNAFNGFVSLKRVVLGNELETIGEKAFYKCTNLSEVSFGGNLRSVGARAFYKCAALTAVSLPDSVVSVGDYAFYKCEAVSSVYLGQGLVSIGDFAFSGCASVTELYLPASLTSIGRQAFRGWKGITGVAIPAGVESIDAHAFYGCSQLTLYVESESAGEGWDKHWNSAYRPIVWGCALSEDKSYVISVQKTEKSITNRNSVNTLSAPTREGYVFVGWHTSSSATEPLYTTEGMIDAPNGRRLYTIWVEEAVDGNEDAVES